jgi:plasmid stability protein
LKGTSQSHFVGYLLVVFNALNVLEIRLNDRVIRRKLQHLLSRIVAGFVSSLRPMASITIRRLDAALIARLRARAAGNGRSIEEEAVEILKHVLQPQLDLSAAIRRHITPLGGVDLVLPRREPVRKPPKY